MSFIRSTVILGCSLLGASAVAMAVPATSNAACLLGISSLVCNNGVLSSPGSTGIINFGPGSKGILNLGPGNTGIGNIGTLNTGLLNIGGVNNGALNLGNFHSGILGLG
jgi:PPE-repeat protein